MGLEGLKLKLTPPSLRRRVISRSLVILLAFSLVSLLRNLNGETHHHNNHPCKVDECAVNFAFLGPFLFSGNGLLSNRFLKPVWTHLESERCKQNINLTTQVVKELKGMNLLSNDVKALCFGPRSVSALLALNSQGISDARVASYMHKSEEEEVLLQYEDASFGFVFSIDLETASSEMERLLKPGGTGAMLVFRSVFPVSSSLLLKMLKSSSVVHVTSLGEEEHVLVVFRRNGYDCSSLPYIGLLEPLLEGEGLDFVRRRIRYLPEFIDLSSRKRLVYIDIGAADHHTNWFFPSYPIDRKAFNTYFVHHNTSVLASYVRSPGVTFIYHPGLGAAKGSVGYHEEPFVEDDGFDFLAWFKETTRSADFVVFKMNTSETEVMFLSELIKSGAIYSVDELFLQCTGYRDCISIIKSLRNSGVFVHQWWED